METAIILITHDLGVVAEMCNRVVYAGRVVEEAPVLELFESLKHPYTAALIGSTPVLGQAEKELVTIPGSVPSPLNPPTGCRFRTRCPLAFDKCSQDEPSFKDYGDEHYAACWLLETGEKGASKLTRENLPEEATLVDV